MRKNVAFAARRRRWRAVDSRPLVFALALLASTVAAASDAVADPLLGRWVGFYFCAQGKTALTVDLLRRGADGAYAGRFSFTAHEDNPGVPSGAYHLTARLDPSGDRLVARPGEWIERPDGYASVGFTVAVEGGRMIGAIDFGGCGSVLLWRTETDLVSQDAPALGVGRNT